ncbi:MAG: hypothetical protein FJZ38_21200 [Candidatus Rokubacteria bacterium]|nr:hypothetical protein [Candidatus Rokubacteria bacterium]
MRWWWRPARAVIVAAEPDAALLSSAAALRRLGARITRYDSEAGTLEARVSSAAVVRVRTAPADEGTTRVHLEGDAAARGVIRRFRGALSA